MQNAPQIILLTMYLIALLLHARDHGKPKTGNNNFWTGFLAMAISMSLLIWGGFFDNLLN